MILICVETKQYNNGWYVQDINRHTVTIGEHIIASRLWRIIYQLEGLQHSWDADSEAACHPEYYKNAS